MSMQSLTKTEFDQVVPSFDCYFNYQDLTPHGWYCYRNKFGLILRDDKARRSRRWCWATIYECDGDFLHNRFSRAASEQAACESLQRSLERAASFSAWWDREVRAGRRQP
jgi:hypothetical protein